MKSERVIVFSPAGEVATANLEYPKDITLFEDDFMIDGKVISKFSVQEILINIEAFSKADDLCSPANIVSHSNLNGVRGSEMIKPAITCPIPDPEVYYN